MSGQGGRWQLCSVWPRMARSSGTHAASSSALVPAAARLPPAHLLPLLDVNNDVVEDAAASGQQGGMLWGLCSWDHRGGARGPGGCEQQGMSG